jgi:NAD(P)-dependent dehydrogenase (short-subunit alcohol dehydrogenase family)
METTVVITGASAGVGRATAHEFAKRGASVALLARGPDGLKAAAAEVERFGGRALAIPTDVADPQSVENAASQIEADFGPIDIWVNNAMTSVFAPVAEIEPEEFRRVTEVTYLGCVYGTMAALKRMQSRGRGIIIQVGSALAYRSIPLQSAYCGSKHAIVGFTDSLRCELIHDRSRIRLTVVHLPAVNTPQFTWVRNKLPRKAQPVPPIFQPEVPARVIVWAADHPRREIWVGGSTYQAIVGQRLIPGLLDLYLGKTGYRAQQYDGPRDPNAPDNLWNPVAGDPGTHGAFDRRAHPRSAMVAVAEHTRTLLVLAGAAFLGAVIARPWSEPRGNKAKPSSR